MNIVWNISNFLTGKLLTYYLRSNGGFDILFMRFLLEAVYIFTDG